MDTKGPFTRLNLSDFTRLAERVTKRTVNGAHITIQLDSGRSFPTRRFAPLGPNDVVVRCDDSVSVLLNDNTELTVEPSWTSSVHQIADGQLDVTIKEISSEEELLGFNRLTRFHYRGSKGIGRTIPLVAITNHNELPLVAGFIELTTSFLVNSARQKILDSVFSDPDRGVGWTQWNGKTARKWVNSLARISRCVVFPELRGLGLSSILAEEAVNFVRSRWHVKGMRPSFIEITADMLRYWPFVERAGFVYIGDTQGNEHRAAGDMRYLLQKAATRGASGKQGMPKGGGGILSLQRSYATHLSQVAKQKGLSLESIVGYLRTSPDKLTDAEWVMFHKVYRRPKPTFMRGLTPAAEAFLRRRSGVVGKMNLRALRDTRRQSHWETPLVISELTIGTRSKPASSARVRRVQEAFGIVTNVIETRIVDNLDLTLRPGEITLVTGPSGSGKSLLLEAIKWSCSSSTFITASQDIEVSGRVEGSLPRLAWPMPCDPNVTPIDALKDLPIEVALNTLAVAGLAEPQVLIRPSKTLSLGQKYRLSIAIGLAQDPDVFVVDELCEPLDRFTSTAVARRLRREASKRKFAVVAATARPDQIVTSLEPDRVLKLASDGGHTWQLRDRA